MQMDTGILEYLELKLQLISNSHQPTNPQSCLYNNKSSDASK